MRRLLALFCILTLLMVSGCTSVSKKSASDTALEAIREDKAPEGTVDVWYLDYVGDTLSNVVLLEYKSLCASAVDFMPAVEFNPRAFATGEELADALTEAFESGTVPDLVLTGSDMPLDPYPFAEKNQLLDLRPLIDADNGFEEEDYYMPVFEGLRTGEYQYLFPLAFTLPCFTISEERIAEYGLIFPENPTGTETIDMLTELASMDNRRPVGWSMGAGTDYMAQMNDILTLSLGLDQTGNDALSAEAHAFMQTTVDEFPDLYQKVTEITDRRTQALFPVTDTCLYLNIAGNAPNFYRMMDTCYDTIEETMRMICFSDWQTGELHAIVTSYAFIPAGADNPHAAYELLRRISASAQNYRTVSGISVNRRHVETMVDNLGMSQGKILAADIRMGAIGTDRAEWLKALYASVSDAVVYVDAR